jgi:hypothetical protein
LKPTSSLAKKHSFWMPSWATHRIWYALLMLNDLAEENGHRPSHRRTLRILTPQGLPESLNRRTTRYPEGELDHQNKWELKTNPISPRVGKLTSQGSHRHHLGGSKNSSGLPQLCHWLQGRRGR